jgi:hypothetical protein
MLFRMEAAHCAGIRLVYGLTSSRITKSPSLFPRLSPLVPVVDPFVGVSFVKVPSESIVLKERSRLIINVRKPIIAEFFCDVN